MCGLNQKKLPMTHAKIEKAIAIIYGQGTKVQLAFNVPINDSYSNVYPILIKECCAALVSKLSSDGFSLTMTAKGLAVDCIG